MVSWGQHAHGILVHQTWWCCKTTQTLHAAACDQTYVLLCREEDNYKRLMERKIKGARSQLQRNRSSGGHANLDPLMWSLSSIVLLLELLTYSRQQMP